MLAGEVMAMLGARLSGVKSMVMTVLLVNPWASVAVTVMSFDPAKR